MTNKPRIEPELNPAYSKALAFHLLKDGCYFACDLVAEHPDMIWIKIDSFTAAPTGPEAAGGVLKINPATMIYPLKDQRGPMALTPKPVPPVNPDLVERMIGQVNLNIILVALNLFELCHAAQSPAAVEGLKVIYPEPSIADVRRLRMQLQG